MSDATDNRRHEPRNQATVKFALHTHDLKQLGELYSENVGRGGVFVRCKTPLPTGSVVRFEIVCKSGTPLTGEAEVMWVRTSDPEHPELWPGMGMRFLNLTPESEALLASLAAVEEIDPDSAVLELEEVMELDEAAEASEAVPVLVSAADMLSDAAQYTNEEEPLELEQEVSEDSVAEMAEDVAAPTTASHNESSGEAMMALPTSYSILDTVLGIDLGTTNSCVAIIRDGAPFVIPNEAQERTVPSVVYYTKKGEIIVGKPAKDQLVVDPKNTIYGAKRFIGRPFNSPTVANLKDTFPYEIVGGVKGQVAIKIRDELVNLEEISAQVLSHIKMIAQEFIDLEVTKAIITVPAYYNDNQRQAVKEAGRIAGLDVQRIVNEPTAAALAYGFNKGYKTRIMVYDLGGGTFDVSILELSGNSFEVLACGGNNFLGGEDFDNAITDYLIATYQRESKTQLSTARIIRERIKQAAEFAKRTLSENDKTTLNVPYLKTSDNTNVNLQMNLDRATLNRVTKQLVDRTINICEEVMRGIGLNKSELNDIILVGGQTRMPLVRNSLHHFFGRPARFDVNPDEVVAMGAALLGAGLKQTDALVLRDTISISIGIALPGGRFKPVIKANTPVPVTKNYKIGTTKDGQENFHIDVFQGESQFVHENEYLGTLLFSDLPVGKRGDVKLNIDFMITEECILKVVATHPETGRSEEALLVTYDTPPSLKEAVTPSAETNVLGDLADADAADAGNE